MGGRGCFSQRFSAENPVLILVPATKHIAPRSNSRSVSGSAQLIKGHKFNLSTPIYFLKAPDLWQRTNPNIAVAINKTTISNRSS